MKKIFKLPVKTVLEDHGVVFLPACGDTCVGKSPFRQRQDGNSFTISISKNCWKDWKLDIGGGPVKFIEYLKKCSAREAEQYLGYKYFGIGEPIFNSKYQAREIWLVPERKSKPLPEADILDKAYRIFLGFCKLDETANEYLLNRGLTQEEIDSVGFKSYPTRAIKFKVMKAFVDAEIDPLNVPGFYKDKKTGNITFMMGKESNILIPVMNANKQIVGLQYRKQTVKAGENRYAWFSSVKFLVENDEGSDGQSPGSPCHVDCGELEKPKTLFITEGYFKGLAIKKTWGTPAISVQGVGNWKNGGVLQAVSQLRDQFPTLERVIIAYDADFTKNPNVAHQANELLIEIEKCQISAFYLSWDITQGKGIDDFLANKKNATDKKVWNLHTAMEFASTFEQALEQQAAQANDEFQMKL